MISPTQSHYHVFRMSEIGTMFWAHSLMSIGAFLLTIFIPIFLLKSGYSLTAVLIFLSLQGFFSILLQYYGAKLVALIGANKSMAVGIIAQICYFGLLITLPQAHWPLAVLSFAWAVYRTIYWVAFHANFSKARGHAAASKQIGMIQAVVAFAKGAAPAIGGIIATLLGINWVYALGITLSVFACIPLFSEKEITARRPVKVRSIKFRKIRPDLASSMANSTTSVAESILWPMLVFLLVPSYASVGVLSSIIALAALLTSVYVGRQVGHRHGGKHYLRQGVAIAGFSDALRLLATSATQIFGVNLFGGVGNSLYMTPFFTRYYSHADEEPRIEYISAMETAHEFAWMLLPLLLIPFSLFLTPGGTLLIGIALAIPANFVIRKIR
jgi:MFS family permease